LYEPHFRRCFKLWIDIAILSDETAGARLAMQPEHILSEVLTRCLAERTRVYFDIKIGKRAAGRIVFELVSCDQLV